MFFRKPTQYSASQLKTEIDRQNKERETVKDKLAESSAQLDKMTQGAKQLINTVALKLQKRLHPGTFTKNDEGIAFVNWRGEVLQINGAACTLLNTTMDALKNKRIDYLVTGTDTVLKLEDCSQSIMAVLAGNSDETHASLLTQQDVKMILNEPVKIVLREGGELFPLRVVISLFDTNPKFLEQITYIVKLQALDISEIASVPEIELTM
jgi:hypothetical protein